MGRKFLSPSSSGGPNAQRFTTSLGTVAFAVDTAVPVIESVETVETVEAVEALFALATSHGDEASAVLLRRQSLHNE